MSSFPNIRILMIQASEKFPLLSFFLNFYPFLTQLYLLQIFHISVKEETSLLLQNGKFYKNFVQVVVSDVPIAY